MNPVSSGGRHAQPSLFSQIKYDLPAGVAVFFVALPLCLGIALASGAPLLSGLVSGIVGGLIVAALSGSQLSVSGPAAGLVVIVLDSVASLGSFNAFLTAVVLAGALQWVFGRLRAGNLAASVPSSVIRGMLAAIGVLLIIKQVPVAFGFASAEHALRHINDDAQALDALSQAMGAVTPNSLIVALVSLVMLFLWDSAWLKRVPLIGRVPGPLVVVLFGVAYHALSVAADPSAEFARHQRVVLPEVGSVSGFLGQLMGPDWSALGRPELYRVVITLAVVASLETLLCLEAADKLDPLKRVAPPNRELEAQGVGNVVAGLLGGLPITAVIVRTSANIQAGAKSRLSAIIHGVLLLLSVLFLANTLRWIPLAALSAVLLHTGFKLAKPAMFVAAWKQGYAVFVPFAITFGAILASDLLIGIMIGFASSMLFVIRANTRGALAITSHDGAHLLRLNKDISFFSKSTLRVYLDRVQPGDILIIDGSRCCFIDRDIREALDDYVSHAAERGIEVELRSMPPAPAPEAPPRRLMKPRSSDAGEVLRQSAAR